MQEYQRRAQKKKTDLNCLDIHQCCQAYMFPAEDQIRSRSVLHLLRVKSNSYLGPNSLGQEVHAIFEMEPVLGHQPCPLLAQLRFPSARVSSEMREAEVP